MASADLRETRRRIKSVEGTKKITRAMELIAASRIPKAIARVNASKPYSSKLVEVIFEVARSNECSAGGSEEPNRSLLQSILDAADRGGIAVGFPGEHQIEE